MACQKAVTTLDLRPGRECGQRKPNNAQIAQLVEQLAFNQLVLGSSPSLRTRFITRSASMVERVFAIRLAIKSEQYTSNLYGLKRFRRFS